VTYSTAGRQPIDGVKVKPLRAIADERGWLMEILRADEADLFTKFGQVLCLGDLPGRRQGLALPPEAG
jgi:dTDP-4-dehydrorhamnose 3,5-epimerase-like enzyme